MKLYEISSHYVEYLRMADSRVEKTEGKNYKFSKKYFGVVLKVNDFKYFAPLSSPSPADYLPTGKIRKSIIPIIRIVENENDTKKLLGKIQLSNMIPIVNENLIKLYNIHSEEDASYRNLIFKQVKSLKLNKDLIEKNAKLLYDQKIKNKDIGYIKSTVDFLLLEKKAIEYKIQENEKKRKPRDSE